MDDHGYYGSAGFVGMSKNLKLHNAAHYEELPRRYLGKSKYDGLTFTEGKTATGKAQTYEDKVRRKASEYLRKAWDKAVNVHGWLRGSAWRSTWATPPSSPATRPASSRYRTSRSSPFHHQSPPKTVNMNDIVLAEGVASATGLIKRESKKVTVPKTPVTGKTMADEAKDLVVKATAAYGALTGNASDDKLLLDWLVKEYGKSL